MPMAMLQMFLILNMYFLVPYFSCIKFNSKIVSAITELNTSLCVRSSECINCSMHVWMCARAIAHITLRSLTIVLYVSVLDNGIIQNLFVCVILCITLFSLLRGLVLVLMNWVKLQGQWHSCSNADLHYADLHLHYISVKTVQWYHTCMCMTNTVLLESRC